MNSDNTPIENSDSDNDTQRKSKKEKEAKDSDKLDAIMNFLKSPKQPTLTQKEQMTDQMKGKIATAAKETSAANFKSPTKQQANETDISFRARTETIESNRQGAQRIMQRMLLTIGGSISPSDLEDPPGTIVTKKMETFEKDLTFIIHNLRHGITATGTAKIMTISDENMKVIELLSCTNDNQQQYTTPQTNHQYHPRQSEQPDTLTFTKCDTDYRRTCRDIIVNSLGVTQESLCDDITIVAKTTGTVLANRVERIVIGDGGCYAEVKRAHVKEDNFDSVKEHKFFDMHCHDKTAVQVYQQKMTVANKKNPPRQCQITGGQQNRAGGYADYKVGMWYFSPDEVYIKVKGKSLLKRDKNTGKTPTMQQLYSQLLTEKRR
jgi:hypothetical protein